MIEKDYDIPIVRLNKMSICQMKMIRLRTALVGEASDVTPSDDKLFSISEFFFLLDIEKKAHHYATVLMEFDHRLSI
ncbi:hypothetical protein DICVIV_07355 [Dictyocaulus viviparus]|uniref:Uncharacterized protein n=1 Tax=Dictyocaulus viviparus TaxID=29172 RepID=A0A0D8XRZ9_DICVI|nr:hypothetical protein DICVIV_07355 [Dictyocaulus viviparus]